MLAAVVGAECYTLLSAAGGDFTPGCTQTEPQPSHVKADEFKPATVCLSWLTAYIMPANVTADLAPWLFSCVDVCF